MFVCRSSSAAASALYQQPYSYVFTRLFCRIRKYQIKSVRSNTLASFASNNCVRIRYSSSSAGDRANEEKEVIDIQASHVSISLNPSNIQHVFAQSLPILLVCVLSADSSCHQYLQKLNSILSAEGYSRKDCIIATLDISEERELVEAMKLPIQSVPTTVALNQGKFIDYLANNSNSPQAVQQLKEFLNKFLGKASNSPAEDEEMTDSTDFTKLSAEKLMSLATAAKDNKSAAQYYSIILNNQHNNNQYKSFRALATAGIVNILIQQAKSCNNADEAKQLATQAQSIIKRLKAESALDPSLIPQLNDSKVIQAFIQAQIEEELILLKPKTLQEYESILSQPSLSNELRSSNLYELSLLLFSQGRLDQAFNTALQLIRANKLLGKALLLKFFDILGPSHDLTTRARKRMSSYLF
jgi:thioredoxin-like negative regulator of GroEL